MGTPTAADVAASVRAEFDPRPGDRGAVKRPCQGCGAMFLKWRGGKRYYCPTCAYERQVAAAEASTRREGPVYEKLVTRTYEFWAGEMRRLGLDQPAPTSR